jgi:hypothetical protein
MVAIPKFHTEFLTEMSCITATPGGLAGSTSGGRPDRGSVWRRSAVKVDANPLRIDPVVGVPIENQEGMGPKLEVHRDT